MAKKIEIDWPKNLAVTGVLQFPLTSAEDLKAVKQWRTEKSIPKPKFDDKIGATLLITQEQVDRIQEHLLTVYYPFAAEYHELTGGDKGIESDDLKTLIKLTEKGDWSQKNLPIRVLTSKDKDKMPETAKDAVAKVKFGGPYRGPSDDDSAGDFIKKAILVDGGNRSVVTIDELVDRNILPERHTNPHKLWWGSGWWFRASLRFNVFDTPSIGTGAYSNALYLLPSRGLPVFGSDTSDADVLEDGDDWVDDDE